MKNLLKATLAVAFIFLTICLFNLGMEDATTNELDHTKLTKFEFCSKKVVLVDSLITDTVKYEELDTSSVVINAYYTDMILTKFVGDAQTFGLDSSEVMDHIKALDAVLVADLSENNNLGVTIYRPDSLSPTGIRGVILIEQKLMSDVDLYALTLYHELGHWFGLDHCGCDNSIMMDEYNRQDTYRVLGDWQKNVKKLMKDIKKKYVRKEKHYAFPAIPDSIKVTEFGLDHVCNH